MLLLLLLMLLLVVNVVCVTVMAAVVAGVKVGVVVEVAGADVVLVRGRRVRRRGVARGAVALRLAPAVL